MYACCRNLLYLLTVSLLFSFPETNRAAWLGSDEDFVDMVQYNSWQYFRDHQNADNGLWRADGNNTYFTANSWACTAGNGFGIGSTITAAYRGWITEEEAYNRIVKLLRTYRNVETSWDGFFRHWYNYADGSTPGSGSEISTIDSSWFICGALLAAEYYKGTEIDQIANELYENMGWNTGYNPWDWQYCEYLIMDILGAGSPTHALTHPDNTVNAWESTVWPHAACPLFWHQWPQAFVDFRYRPDGRAINHFNEARAHTLEHRQKCIDLNAAESWKYDDYGSNCWGLTAAEASTGYIAMHPFDTEWMTDSGSFSPFALPACMPFTPYEAREAMKYVHDTYEANGVFGTYGFMQTLNSGQANSGASYYSHKIPSADVGCNVVSIENFRSGIPWRYFMRHARIQDGMSKLGMPQSIWLAYHEDFNDGSYPNAWGGSLSTTNTDGSAPTGTYTAITYFNEWVNTNALLMTANGSGDVVRIGLNETDQSAKDMLSLWVRGASGGENISVGLRDAEGHEVLVGVAPYTESGSITTTWTQAIIPLRSFAVSGDANNDVRITFLGDVTFRFNAAGAVYVDDVAFIEDSQAPGPPPTFGAACVDGRVHMRWDAAAGDDVVGYHLWRRPDAVSGFNRINGTMLSFKYSEIDAAVETRWGEDFYYAVQALDRHENGSSFSAGVYEQRVDIGRHTDLDWGDGKDPNVFGGTSGGWGTGPSATFEEETTWNTDIGWVRRCAADAAASGVFFPLNDANLGDYDALSFWVKGAGGSEDVEVGLKSSDSTEIKVDLARYTAGGTIPTNWTHVTIPLIDVEGVDLTAMQNMSLTFGAAGAVYLDDVRFEKMQKDADILFALEAEQADAYNGGDTNDFKWNARQAYCLGNSWGADAGDYARFNINPTGAINEAYVEVRYACGASTGHILNILLDSTPRATLNATPTGGWGDEASQFRSTPVRVGTIAAGSRTLEIATTNSGDAINLDCLLIYSAYSWFREAEDYDSQSGSTGSDYKPAASGGQVLGASWGTNAGDYAEYTGVAFSSPLSNAVLRVRYAQDWNDGRLVGVMIDGTNRGSIALPNTGGWLDETFEGSLAELPLGDISAGAHDLRLEAATVDEAVNLDWLAIVGDMTDLKEYDTDSDGLTDSQEGLYGTLTGSADTDSDGLTDLEEVSTLKGHLTDPDDADSDDDEMSDGNESIAGTDPNNAGSLFVLFSATPQPDGSIRIQWYGSPGHYYDISYSDSGIADLDSFQSITDPENIVLTESYGTYTDDGTGTSPAPNDPGVDIRLYRIRAYTP